MMFLIELALLKALQKQSEKKPCPICRHFITRGLYRSYLNHCKLQPEMMIADYVIEAFHENLLQIYWFRCIVSKFIIFFVICRENFMCRIKGEKKQIFFKKKLSY